MSEQITKKIQSFLKSELNINIPLNALDLKNGWKLVKQGGDYSIDWVAKGIDETNQFDSRYEMIERGLDYIVWKNTIDKHQIKRKFIVLIGLGNLGNYRLDWSN